MTGPTWLDILNTLLETAVLLVIIFDIKLYYAREKKQEIRDQNQDSRDAQYLKLQQQVVSLLDKQVGTTEEVVEELIDLNDGRQPEVIEDEPDKDRVYNTQTETSVPELTRPASDAPADSGSVGQREVLVSSAAS